MEYAFEPLGLLVDLVGSREWTYMMAATFHPAVPCLGHDRQDPVLDLWMRSQELLTKIVLLLFNCVVSLQDASSKLGTHLRGKNAAAGVRSDILNFLPLHFRHRTQHKTSIPGPFHNNLLRTTSQRVD